MPKGIYDHTKSKPMPRLKFFKDENWLREEYLTNGKTTIDIGKELNMSANAVNRWLKKFNIPLRDCRSPEALKKMQEGGLRYMESLNPFTKEYLNEEYVINRKTINQIAAENNCSWDCVRRKLKKFGFIIKERDRNNGIPKRTTSESRKFQREAIRKFGYRCMICGYDRIVHAHHIERRSIAGDDSMDNAIMLCPNHHAEADLGIITPEELRKFKS